MTISACELGNGDKLYWWDADAGRWIKADPQFYDSGCITFVVSDASSPALSQLQGTYFAVGMSVADPGGPYLAAVDTTISFDGTASHASDGDDLAFAWDFGDGSTGTGVIPTHSYAAPGIYDVCLTVNVGAIDSEPVCTLAVGPSPMVPTPSALKSGGKTPMPLNTLSMTTA